MAKYAPSMLELLRSIGLTGSKLANATLGGMRLHLLKAAAVKVVVRLLFSAFPQKDTFREAVRRLEAILRNRG